jgi:EAL domain-containing protein (putative c-di-GMP-specific phosphodiesterase class I)
VVEQALLDSGLPEHQLELEITETSILDQSPAIVEAVSALTEMGVSFALDDFGTGYSSLSSLQRFPIDRIKIDRSFVSGIGKNEGDEALTSAICAFARRLDQRVVAEGVETETHARVLADLGCQELQGYLFGRPDSAEGFERYLESEKPASLAPPRGSG